MVSDPSELLATWLRNRGHPLTRQEQFARSWHANTSLPQHVWLLTMQASNQAVSAMLNNSQQDVARARQQLSQLQIASEQDKLFVQVLEVRALQCTSA